MKNQISYREAEVVEYQGLYQLIQRCFDEFVAPGYSPEGIAAFNQYIEPTAIHKRLKRGNICIVALDGFRIVGMTEVRSMTHIALLFVAKEYQRQGIGQELTRRAIQAGKDRIADLHRWTVNAAPDAVGAYEKMGFRAVDQEQVNQGIRYVPMEYLETEG